MTRIPACLVLIGSIGLSFAVYPPCVAADELEASLPEELRRAQVELGERLVKHARGLYAQGEFRDVGTVLDRARLLGVELSTVTALSDTMGTMALPKAWGSAFLSKGKPSMIRECLERRAGEPLRTTKGFIADWDRRLLIQDLDYLRRAEKAIGGMRRAGKSVRVEAMVMALTPEAARSPIDETSRLDPPQPSTEWIRTFGKDEVAATRQLFKDAGAVVSSPTVTSKDREAFNSVVVTQRAFIEKLELRETEVGVSIEPGIGVLSDGIEIEGFPQIGEGDSLRLYLRSTWRHFVDFQALTFEDETFAKEPVPIQLPIVRENRRSADLTFRPGEAILLGRTPGEDAKADGKIFWLWVEASVVSE